MEKGRFKISDEELPTILFSSDLESYVKWNRTFWEKYVFFVHMKL